MEQQNNDEMSMNQIPEMELSQKSLKITVSGEVASGKSLLLSIIKDCLERDYFFRTRFAGCQIELVEKVEDLKNEEESDDKV